MSIRVYVVEVMLADGVTWIAIAKCLTPMSAAEIVRVLLSAEHNRPSRIQVYSEIATEHISD